MWGWREMEGDGVEMKGDGVGRMIGVGVGKDGVEGDRVGMKRGWSKDGGNGVGMEGDVLEMEGGGGDGVGRMN